MRRGRWPAAIAATVQLKRRWGSWAAVYCLRQAAMAVMSFYLSNIAGNPHLEPHLSSLTYDVQLQDVISASLLNISTKPQPGASCFLN